MSRLIQKYSGTVLKLIVITVLFGAASYSQNKVPIPYFDLGVRSARNTGEVSLSLQILFLITILSIAPSIIIMTTSFIRVAIVLKFIQRSLSLQQEPPNQVIMGLALFISFYIMTPTITEIYNDAWQPFSKQEITTDEFLSRSLIPIRKFMFSQTRENDIGLFLHLGNSEAPETQEDVSTIVLVPAFIISELTRAFEIGIMLFIPFVVIDIIVASILMSIGMIMVPPIMISLPFKIILFVLIDGWHLITLQVVKSFGV